MQVYCDFDGTISQVDTTDWVLSHLAYPEWERVEADWIAGRISASECMRAQIALIHADDAALDGALDTVGLDPSFAPFARWCAAQAISLTIVSDGVDYFIARLLARHDLDHLPLASNRLAGGAGRRRLLQPFAAAACAAGAGVCKCAVVAGTPAAHGRNPIVYIGDGRSDFCVAGQADLLFAKDKLAAHAGARGLPFTPFTSFSDVQARLAMLFEPVVVAARARAR